MNLSGSIFMKYSFIDDAIADIDPDAEYSLDEYNELSRDLSVRLLMGNLVNLVPTFVLIVIAVGAFINTKKMEEELKPKMDDRLYNLSIT